MFPAIADALKAIRSGFGSEIISLKGLEGDGLIAGQGVETNSPASWYLTNGYYGIAQAAYGAYPRFQPGDRALEIPALLAGVKIIAEDIGSLPHLTYERSRDRASTDLATEHPLFSTLKNLWNPEISAGEGVEALTAHALLTGGGFAEIQRKGSSVFLWPWMPDEIAIDRDSRGRLYYVRHIMGQSDKQYARTDVFHLRGFTMQGAVGENLLRRARQAIGLTRSMQDYAARYFENDATPGVTIRFPVGAPKLDQDGMKLLKRKWAEHHKGNPFEPAILQDGAEVEKVGTGAQDAQLIEQRKFQVIECCRLLRLSPHKLADLDRATFSNIEQLAIEHVTNTLVPWVERWKRAVHRCLLTTDEQLADRVYAEHNYAALLRGDFATQTEGWRKLLEKGVLSINEVRRWQNLNPVPGGDERLVQLNLGPLQDVAAGATLHVVREAMNSTPDPKLKKMLEGLVIDMEAAIASSGERRFVPVSQLAQKG